LDNVLRHTEAGTDVAVILSDGPRLIVQDNGPGIPATERDQVIKRLYRLERSRTTPGNGLGLALVSAVAELHDAELHLEDATPGLRVVIDFRKGKKQVTRY
jgi:signal transduction histidine kinase